MKMDGVNPADIMKSLSIEDNIDSVFKSGEGLGASGSFFFFSKDNRFLIKTCSTYEREILINMLDPFIEHLKSVNNKSLIAKIYGVFTIKSNVFKQVDVMIMKNTSAKKNRLNYSVKFDLKGSLFNREVPLPANLTKQKLRRQGFSGVLKDVNFLKMQKEFEYLNFSEQECSEYHNMIYNDTKFLNS